MKKFLGAHIKTFYGKHKKKVPSININMKTIALNIGNQFDATLQQLTKHPKGGTRVIKDTHG